MNLGNVRMFLWFALFAFAWLTYTAWVTDHAPPPVEMPPAVGPLPGDQVAPPSSVPTLAPEETNGAATVTPQVPASAPQELVRVRTDVLDVAIDLRGGDLVRADLLEYPVDKERPDEVVRLLDYAPGKRWVFESGLVQAGNGSSPNHLARFSASRPEYTLEPGEDTLTVTLDWVDGDGTVRAQKVYTFHRGKYRVDLELKLENEGVAPWRGAAYAQMARLHDPPKRSYFSVDSYSFTGPVFYDGSSFEHIDVEDLAKKPIDEQHTGAWYAAIQHHFLAALVPPPEDTVDYDATVNERGEYTLRALGPVVTVAPGEAFDYSYALYVGPKLQEQLADVANELELTVDYGKLTFLAKPLFLLLSWVEGWVGNWGWAIVLVTLLIKLVFYPLTAASGKSMAKMRELAPRMKQLQERYKDDRQKLSQAMMELYKKEKVNPAAGCLPILIQMPFFFAFYWVLVESVEMRQAPFMLWINDLSSRDPFFVLPILMGAAMLLQTRLNPTPPDPVQARVMQIMPIVFTAFFMLFPAGLVLYWLTNTVFSIVQQWRINQVVHAQKQKKAAA